MTKVNGSNGAVGAQLVGGLKAPDAETAMRTAMRFLDHHLYAVTDGETGDRSQWVYWQIEKLRAVDGIDPEAIPDDVADPRKLTESGQIQCLTVEESVTSLPAGALGYADAAVDSYATFSRLRNEGVIPSGVKFQVSLPTPYATVIPWIAMADQQHFFPVYTDALKAEIDTITDAVGDDLLLQFDVAVEVGVLTGAFKASEGLEDKAAILQTLRDAFTLIPTGVECGLHLCYGDYQHQHFTVPDDLGLCVEFAEAVSNEAAYVHMPVDRDSGRSAAYFAPLRDLSVRRLALGVIDYEGDADRTQELIDAAADGSGGLEFTVATECGMARIDEREGGGPSLERLLELHAEKAAPIR